MTQLSIAHNRRRNPLLWRVLFEFSGAFQNNMIQWVTCIGTGWREKGFGTCSAVKSGSSLMVETMMECMSICSLSSSSSDRSRDWLSNFCPTDRDRRWVRLLFLKRLARLFARQHFIKNWKVACVNAGQPYMSVLPHAPLGSEWAGVGCECATSSSPRPSRCHSYLSECSTPWREASENIMRNQWSKEERGRGRRRSSQLPVSFSSECDTALLGGVTEHSAV